MGQILVKKIQLEKVEVKRNQKYGVRNGKEVRGDEELGAGDVLGNRRPGRGNQEIKSKRSAGTGRGGLGATRGPGSGPPSLHPSLRQVSGVEMSDSRQSAARNRAGLTSQGTQTPSCGQRQGWRGKPRAPRGARQGLPRVGVAVYRPRRPWPPK